jgi:hypothetical protein
MLRVLGLPVFAGTTGQQFVAVGSTGQVLTSPDGLAWTPRTSGTFFRLRGVASSPDLFVAAGQGGRIITSPDGVNWTIRISGTSETFRGVATNATTFVTVGGQSAAMIRYSADGITWNAAAVPASPSPSGALRAVAWGNNQFIAVGAQATVLTSPDGISWTVRSSGGTDRYDGVVWTGTEFVVLTKSGQVLRGTDGITWVSSQSYPPLWLEGLTWSDARFVAVGAAGTIKTSLDGASWSSVTPPILASSTLHAVVWSGTQMAPTGDPVALLGSIAPYFLDLPSTRTIALGASTTFSTVFSAIGATFQWLKNDAPLPSQTSTSLTLTNAQISDIGVYRIEASYLGGTYTSNPVNFGLIGYGTTGQQFIAVGAGGTILSSPDGLTWSPRVSGTTARLRAVLASHNLFVAVGQAGTILTSPDGNVWTPRPVAYGASPPMLRGIAMSPTRFVAVGGGTSSILNVGSIVSSVDGINWTSFTTTMSSPRAIAYGNGLFVHVGVSGAIYSSPDGLGWNHRPSGTTERLDGIVWTGTQFVVLSQTGKTLTSPDGITWSITQGFPPLWLEGLAWNENRFVAVGSTGGPIYTSTNGDHWSTTASGTAQTLHGVAWSGAKMNPVGNPVALLGNISPYVTTQPLDQSVAEGASTTLNVAVSSLNAAFQWFKNSAPIGGATSSTLSLSNVDSPAVYNVQVTAGGVTFPSNDALVSVLGLGTLGKQFITVGVDGTLLTSPSGETWTTRTSGSSLRLRSAAAAANVAVVVGESGTILSSANGVTWTPRGSGTTANLRGVARNQTHFVAVGGSTSSVVLRSTNGVTWTPQTLLPTVPFRAVAWGNNLFVAVGNNGLIMTSPTGATGSWTPRTSGVSLTLDGVAWLGTQFAAITRSGFVLTSPNGITWTSVGQSFPPVWLEGLAWNDQRYVAVGSLGTIATSANGSTWGAAISNTPMTLHGITWTGSPSIQSGNPIALLNNIPANPISDPYAAWVAAKGLTPAQSGLTLDPDADGIVNLLEYFLGLNPLVSDGTGAPTGEIEGSEFAFRFNRSKAAAGATYRVVSSSDLVTWTPTTSAPVLESSTADLETYVVKFSMVAPRLFVRLEVTFGAAVVGGP